MASHKGCTQTRRQPWPGLLRQVQNLKADEERGQETGGETGLNAAIGTRKQQFNRSGCFLTWIQCRVAAAGPADTAALLSVLLSSRWVYSWFRFAAQTPASAPDKCPSQEI